MAGIWNRNAAGGWRIAALDGEAYRLVGYPVQPEPIAAGASRSARPAPELHRCIISGREARVLLCARGGKVVWINGRALQTHVRHLQDQDSIRWRGADTFFFTYERLPVAELFAGRDEVTFCARCLLEIEPDRQLAVQCVTCDLFYHQDADAGLECFTHAKECTQCSTPSDFNAGYRWSPEDL